MISLNIAIAALTLASTLSAFGGKTWTEGSEPLFKRITFRGRIALTCLVLVFIAGISKEFASRAASKRAEDQIVNLNALNTALKDQLAPIEATISNLSNWLQNAKAQFPDKVPSVANATKAELEHPQQLIEQSIATAISIALSGEEQYTKGQYAEALRRFLQADKLVEVAPIKARIADSYFALGNYEKAVQYEEIAIRFFPDWSGPPFRLAQSLYELGRYDEAVQPADRSCQLGFPTACALAETIKRRRK